MSDGGIPSQRHGASPWTNTLSRTRGKYSSHGRIPSQVHGAAIRPLYEYDLKNMAQVVVRRRIPFRTWGKYYVHRRIVPIRRMDFASNRRICLFSSGVCKYMCLHGLDLLDIMKVRFLFAWRRANYSSATDE